MDCASCGRTNPTGARFCGGCGASLVLRCPACAAECPPDARFCTSCGAAVHAQPAATAVSRKIVTVVFADLIGSVSLHERLDAESARRLMARYHRAMTAAIEVHGGRVVQLLGDGVLAAFGVPRVAEDDAVRAVRAAVGMQRTFRELARDAGVAMQGVGLRVAVNTGEIVVSDDENSVMGDPTNVAARLQQEARDGDVIVGEGTQRLVGEVVTLAPLGSFALRGRTETVAAYRVVSLDRPASQQAIAFVGRDEEVRRLVSVYEVAVATPAARLVVLLGSPGLGKSRLVAEFTRRAGDRATVLAARCDAAGGTTFSPLAEALRALLRIDEGAGGDVLRAAIDSVVPGDDAERTRIATGIDALLAGTPAPPEETFFVVRRLLGALAAVRPVVLVIDDLHWAEPLLLDLVEHLVQWSSGVPLLILVAARPELRDTRSSLATPGPGVADVVTLGGLDASAATRLAANVIGGAELPAALAGRVLATSEGNPLFVAELVRMLVQDGTLVREGDRWITTVEISKLDMPPTIQVLLAARIERLRPEERLVLERAAVIGRHFSRAGVAHLLPHGTGDLDARLEALRRSELIERDTGWFFGEPALRFHHVLIRDAAYRRVLKETRAEVHERVADWITSRAPDAVEHDETIGWHLEQAHQNLRELGPIDARGRSLGERAARHLGTAGRRALAREDLALAAGLLGRALDRLDSADPARADLALEWCEALLSGGEVGPAARAIDELAQLVGDSDRLRAWHTCFAGQLAALTDPQSLRATADSVAHAAAVLAAAGDAAGEAKAHSVHAGALSRLGEVGACEAVLDKALAAARRARDRRRANAVLAGAPVAALWGPSPVTRASGRCLDVVRVLRITQGAPTVEAVALRCQAVLETLRGRGDAARRMIASSRNMVEELGIAQQLFEADVFAGLIELLEGDAEAAEQWLRSAYDGLRERGLGIDAARAAALLGRALLAQGRASEAEALSHESESLAGDDLKAAIAWRGVRAEAVALRGESATAVELARAAVAIAAATDALLDHADARQSLATALRAAGRGAEANDEETRAIELWEAKGATLLLARVARPGTTVAGAAADRAESRRSGRRRVRGNAATANTSRLDAALAARDADALQDLYLPDVEVVHHETGIVFGRDASVEHFRTMMSQSETFSFVHETLATLGDSLALSRAGFRATEVAVDGLSLGAVETDQVSVVEVDADGRASRVEVFAVERLTDAIARFYSRYMEHLPEGAARERAATTARVITVLLGIGDPDALAEGTAHDHIFVDHRLLGFATSQGRRVLRVGHQALLEVASDIAIHVNDVLELRPDAFLLRSTTSGTDRSSGGRFEREMLQLRIFGADGRMQRTEWFDADRVADALARFDELTQPRKPAPRLRENFATEMMRRINAVVAARDVSALRDLWTEDAVIVHRPTGISYGRDAAVGRFRAGFEEATGMSAVQVPLATLGARLGLSRLHGSATGIVADGQSFGAVEFDPSLVFEANDRSQAVRVEIFGEGHLAEAIARLYERHAELSLAGPERARAAMTARAVAAVLPADIDAIAAVLAPDIEYVDHRPLGLGAARGAEIYLRGLRSLFDGMRGALATDNEVIVATSEGLLLRRRTTGVLRDGGGAFEHRMLMFWLFGVDGRITHIEMFEPGCDAEALARFDALTKTMRAPDLTNSASRCVERSERCLSERDWDGLVACHAPTCVMDDRRALVRLKLTSEQFFENQRVIFSVPWIRFRSELVATRGERLALLWVRFAGEAPDSGDIHIDHLSVVEVDVDGRATAIVIFDENDDSTAWAELDARYHAGEAAPHASVVAGMRDFSRAFAARDWDALAARCAPQIEIRDHRRLGWETLHGPAAYVEALRALVELAPDTALRLDHVEMCAQGYLVVTVWSGTRDGGAFEEPSLMVAELDAEGRVAHFDQYELERLVEARARFASVRASGARDLLRIPPNAASRAGDRLREFALAADWDALRDLCAPIVFDDRRPLLRIRGDCETIVANTRAIGRDIWERSARTLLATAGDRLALHRNRFRGDETTSAFEVDTLEVTEVNADGRIVAAVIFDSDARMAAGDEMLERYARSDIGALRPAATWEMARAMRDHDLDLLRASVPEDFIFHDHRRVGAGRLERDAYIAWLAGLFEQSTDAVIEPLHVVAAETHAVLSVGHTFGTRVEGGAFESVFVQLAGPFGIELYELDDLDRARARFEELRPRKRSAQRAVGERSSSGSLRIPPNAATRASDRLGQARDAHDWDVVTGLCSPSMLLDDRRRGSLVQGDRDTFLASARFVSSHEGRVSVTVLATAGDRLALRRMHVAGTAGGGEADSEFLSLIEVDADGCVSALIAFDPEDRRAASAEMSARFMRGDEMPARSASAIDVLRSLIEHELEPLRASLPDDFVLDDHRRAGLGRVEGGELFVRSFVALFEQSTDLMTEGLYTIAIGEHGILDMAHMFGTLKASGGDFESVYLRLFVIQDGRFVRLELFEADDLATARARFDALGAARP